VASDYKVDIEGLGDFQKALRALGPEFPKQLTKVNKEIATSVADAAKASARGQGGVAAKAAGSIRSGAEQRSGFVRIDSTGRYPFALGAEFGSLRYHQFKHWRGNQWTPSGGDGVGYFLHPTIRAKQSEILERYEKALDDLAKHAFPA
jgi:hypothetical protein